MLRNPDRQRRAGVARSDVPGTVLLLADEPALGRAPAHLGADASALEASQLAAAALEDTLIAIRASRVEHRIVVGEGRGEPWRRALSARGFAIVDQAGVPAGERVAAAFAAVAPSEGDRVADVRSGARLLLGQATPQVNADLLHTSWEGADAVIGLSGDGRWWAVGLRADVDPYACFAGLEGPSSRAGSAQLNRFVDLGLNVTLLPPLRRVHRAQDAELVAYQHPRLLFSEVYRRLSDQRPRQAPGRLFDQGYTGHPLRVDRESGEPTLTVDVTRWSGPADDVDRLVLARCEAPVLDLGCGPGRMVKALTESGLPALGVDISAEAVDLSMQAGAPALRTRLEDPLPAEGRWATVLLIDGNVGIGGDVARLLQRCRDLVAPGGLVVCEVDPAPELHEDADLLLRSEGTISAMPWSRIGAAALGALASRLDLWVGEEWSAGGRVFVALRRSG